MLNHSNMPFWSIHCLPTAYPHPRLPSPCYPQIPAPAQVGWHELTCPLVLWRLNSQHFCKTFGLMQGPCTSLKWPLGLGSKTSSKWKKDSNPCFKFDVAHTLPFNILRRNTVDKGCFRPLHILATQCMSLKCLHWWF